MIPYLSFLCSQNVNQYFLYVICYAGLHYRARYFVNLSFKEKHSMLVMTKFFSCKISKSSWISKRVDKTEKALFQTLPNLFNFNCIWCILCQTHIRFGSGFTSQQTISHEIRGLQFARARLALGLRIRPLYSLFVDSVTKGLVSLWLYQY